MPIPVAIPASCKGCGAAAGGLGGAWTYLPKPHLTLLPSWTARIYCFPQGVQESQHNRVTSSDRRAPWHGCIPSLAPKAPTGVWGRQLCRAALRDHQGLLDAGASSSMKQLSLIRIQFTTNRRGGSTTFSKTATKDACLS